MNITLKDPSSAQLRIACSVRKSLWSYAVESALELHRVVDEIYPDGSRLMRFLVPDFVDRYFTTSWGTKLVTSEEVSSLNITKHFRIFIGHYLHEERQLFLSNLFLFFSEYI